MQKWIVNKEEHGQSLLTFLKNHLDANVSQKAIKRLLDAKRCRINDKIERFGQRVLGFGDCVSLLLENLSKKLEMEKTRILYEDDNFFAYNKPSGISCDEKGIVLLVHAYNKNLRLCHRLDKETSGVLIFAKNDEAEQEMLRLFKERKVEKIYLAIVDKIPIKSGGKIELPLEKKQQQEGQVIWGIAASKGLPAVTEWKVLKTGDKASLIECMPKTGRTHQIRIHLSEIGHPILGDTQYGKHFSSRYQPLRILLHAERVRFFYKSEILDIQAPVPDDFLKALRDLKLDF